MIPCGRCGARPGDIYQGDLAPAELGLLLETLAPDNLTKFAQRLKELRDTKRSAHLTYEVKVHRGEVAEERFLADRWIDGRRRRA